MRRCRRHGPRRSHGSARPACASATRPFRSSMTWSRSTPRAASRRPRRIAIHRERLKQRGAGVDPFIRVRIERGGTVPACDYIEMAQTRAAAGAGDGRADGASSMRWCCRRRRSWRPSSPRSRQSDEFGRKNALLLRNTNPVNFFDLCAISLPLPRQNGLSTGLMLVGRNGQDRRLFNIAAAVENRLKS